MNRVFKSLLTVLLAIACVIAQETSCNEEPGFGGLISEAKFELRGSDIGVKLEQWSTELKSKNIKLKLLFDEDGFVQMLKMISLGKRISKTEETLTGEDINNMVSFVYILERVGGEAPPGLRDLIVSRLNNCAGKNWRESLLILKGGS